MHLPNRLKALYTEYPRQYWLMITGIVFATAGGFLNDNIAPRAIWIGGLLIGLTSTLGLMLLSRVSLPRRTPVTEL